MQPLLAVIAEVRRVAQLWLRPGNASCGGNVTAFFLDLWRNLPGHLRLQGGRAAAGFCLPERWALWEQLPRPHVVVAPWSQPMQKLIKGDLPWPRTEVTELAYQSRHWPHPRRRVRLRHPVRDDESRVGKRLRDVPGDRFQALVTRLPAATHPPLAGWRCYNGRADGEHVIKELQSGLALPTLCLAKFGASEAALSLATLTCNLTGLCHRHLGWQQKGTRPTLRGWRFVTAGVLRHPRGKATIKRAGPRPERAWWRR